MSEILGTCPVCSGSITLANRHASATYVIGAMTALARVETFDSAECRAKWWTEGDASELAIVGDDDGSGRAFLPAADRGLSVAVLEQDPDRAPLTNVRPDGSLEPNVAALREQWEMAEPGDVNGWWMSPISQEEHSALRAAFAAEVASTLAAEPEASP